ncbi:MAG: RidA family protein [Bryobacterales bacterium]|nr:RidA family protein [Bryobacterales bacterium]
MPSRRKLFAAATAAALPAAAAAQSTTKGKKQAWQRPNAKGTPLYSQITAFGDLVFAAGHGVAEGDAKTQTTRVLDQISEALERTKSSMEKVLKCNVYLATLDDYKAMNEAFMGRFGAQPPVRTTIAVAGGIPLKGCLVEIDVIAHR